LALAGRRAASSGWTAWEEHPAASPGRLNQLLPIVSDFPARHIGPRKSEAKEMLSLVGLDNLDALTDAAVPANIKLNRDLDMEAPYGSGQYLPAILKA